MSLPSWGASSVPGSAAEECQKACEEATSMVQQLGKSELQKLMDDSDALNRLASDLETVTTLCLSTY